MDSTLIATLVGGLLALAGSFSATFIAEKLRAKYASRIRREEIYGERQADADRWAYRLAKLASSLAAEKKVDALQAMFREEEDWYWINRLYLVDDFANNWLAARNIVRTLAPGQQIPAQFTVCIGAATDGIYKRTGHKPLTARSD